MPDVIFYEAFEEEADWLKRFIPDDLEADFTWKTIQECGHAEPPAPVISIRTQSQLPTDWANQLDGILSRSTGYDHLQKYREISKKKISCGYLPLYCHRAVAEQAMLLWMSLLRKLPRQIQQFTNFDRDGLTGFECEHKTIAIVGVGNIGSQIVRIANGLGMKVMGVDLVHRHDFVEYFSPLEAISVADIIVCSMNLTSENAGYFKYELLSRAKKGSFFVNIARGEMSPSTDLLRLLDESRLAGIALDVYNQESSLAVALRKQQRIDESEIDATLELSNRPEVILTPHNAFNTVEAVERKAKQSVEQVVHFLQSQIFKWPVPD